MKIKFSATYEGKCDICKKDSIVFTVGDEDTHRVVTVCKKCTEDMGDIQTSEVIEKHGKVNKYHFEEGMKVHRKLTAG